MIRLEPKTYEMLRKVGGLGSMGDWKASNTSSLVLFLFRLEVKQSIFSV